MEKPVTISKEMGVSHIDFFRDFNRLVSPDVYTHTGNLITVPGATPEKYIEVRYSEEKLRVITENAKFPYTFVDITFIGLDEAEQKKWLRGFNIAFFRGGG